MQIPLFQALEQLETDLDNPVRVVRWPEGQCNRLYRLETARRTLALRLNHPDTESLGVDRAAERALLAALAGQDWSPAVVEAGDRWLLTEWETGRNPAGGAQTDLDALVRRLAAVHSAPAVGRPLNIARQIDYLRQRAPALPSRVDAALTARCDAYRWPERPVLCHHDWHPGNIIEHGNGWTLLDWEFAAPGDPAMDLAAASIGFELNERQRRVLAETFEIGDERLDRARCLMEGLALVWYRANPDLQSTPLPTPEDWLARWG